MKNYFYRILGRYISIYKRPDDSIVEIYPQHDSLIKLFNSERTAVLCSRELTQGNFKNIRCIATLEEIAQYNPDYILLNGNLHFESDIQILLEKIYSICRPSTRLIILYYSSLWKPIISLATKFHLRHKTPEQNWISHIDIDNFLHLAGFEALRRMHRVIVPVYVPLFSEIINRFISPLPLLNYLNMVNILIARPILPKTFTKPPSVSVVIPARNEAGTIEEIIQRMPRMTPLDELIFIEGHSKDDTWHVLEQMAQKYSSKISIQIARQEGIGKGDAVRKGFSLAKNEILMILDADLSVMPEDLTKFYKALVQGKGDFINGSRLVYPLENKSMRFLNILGNKAFAIAFSFVLGQRLKDTLCGTKAIFKTDYDWIASHRSYFGEFDPFGDFDLLFGANRLGLKIIEIPVPYKQRKYGATNIQRWRHGVLLFKMLYFAARKMQFV